MKLSAKERTKLEYKKLAGSAYSDILIYGAVDLGTTKFRPAVSKVARVELSHATPAELAKLVDRYTAKPPTMALLEVLCAAFADGFTELGYAGAPAKHAKGAVACGEALGRLVKRRGLPPEFGQGAIAGLVYFWLKSKTKSAKLAAAFEALVPEAVTDGSLAFRLARYWAARRDRTRMLHYLRLAMQYGQNTMEADDPEFKPYARDAEFKAVCNAMETKAIAEYR